MREIPHSTLSTVKTELSIAYSPIDSLHPYARNARTHTKHQLRQIAESIRLFGFTNPILVDSTDRIIAGHGRVEAAKILGLSQVPTIRLENLNEDQIRAYIIADNKLAENAGWDKSILAIELQHLMTLDCTDFDVTITGFEVPEIDIILEEARESSAALESIPEPDLNQPTVTQPGDLWLLGKHRIFCGNALHDDTYRLLMGKMRAAVVFTDPPFNVKIDGHATGNGAIRHREFAMASGEMSEAEFLSFLNNSLRLLANYSANSSVHYICMDWRHVGDLIAAGNQNYDQFLKLLRLFLAEKQFESILGMDVSWRSLEIAKERLRLDELPERQRGRIELIQGSLTYRDQRLSAFEAAAIVEVIEHLDAARLATFERIVFEFARPKHVVLTTPNAEYNSVFGTLPAGEFRHGDHRFEWKRSEFETWANGVAERFGYEVRFEPVGPLDAALGAPTQMAVFAQKEVTA